MSLVWTNSTRPATSDDTVPSLVERGVQAREQADYATAHSLLGEAVERAETARPRDPVLLAAALNALGMLCKDTGTYDEGRRHYERALELLDEAGATPHDIATIYHNLGGMMHARGDWAAAEELARRGLSLRLAAAEQRPDAVVADMIALAAILEGTGKYDEAAECCREALARLQALPDDMARTLASEFAVALNNLGSMEARQGRYDKATALLERALGVKRRLLAPDHPDVALSMHNLASVWMRRGEPTRALPLFTESHAIFLRRLGEAHRKTVRAVEALARCRATLEEGANTEP